MNIGNQTYKTAACEIDEDDYKIIISCDFGDDSK
jgi:hypothetical protein